MLDFIRTGLARKRRARRPILVGILLSTGLSLTSVGQGSGLTWPSLPELAGSTGGEFRVNESGSATYSIPINLPAGIAGLTPQLGISYDSQGGNGHLGKGWSLSGLSSITRCRPTLEQDDSTSESHNKFCLDGQRLMAVSGNYGANGTEYRTEIDGQSKVVSYGAVSGYPQWFKVWRKDGSVSEYGNTTDARIEAGGTTRPLVWAVNKIQDSVLNSNNAIRFSYTENNSAGEYTINNITYAGGKHQVNFVYYDSRPDKAVFYAEGAQAILNKRLEAIEVEVSGVLLRRHILRYQISEVTSTSRITSVQECNNSHCFPETRFDWEALEAGYQTVKTAAVVGGTKKARPADLNGDGLEDLIVVGTNHLYSYISDGSQLVKKGQSFYRSGIINADKDWHLSDFNYDGKHDLLYKDGNWKIRLSDGQDFVGQYIDTGIPSASSALADVDGDGMMDIVYTDGGKAGSSAQSEPVLKSDSSSTPSPSPSPPPPDFGGGCIPGKPCTMPLSAFNTSVATKQIAVRYSRRNKNADSPYHSILQFFSLDNQVASNNSNFPA
ncbi:MAG: SpvB/TcaC N-terminal domain-containing protein [Endozoicomonas sp.]|uniref:SpvB/TcaC N-terminal domain-containing protein n=1 Tax=Endozoicomonas sp. TaxID=1892382 RepID=UPI003D9BD605